MEYICRTCLYISNSEFIFRKLDKVKAVLELFIPEVRSLVGRDTLVCEQCYSFLKAVNSFKQKCIATQEKLYSMNMTTVRDSHNSLLQNISRECCIMSHSSFLSPNYSSVLLPYVSLQPPITPYCTTKKPSENAKVVKNKNCDKDITLKKLNESVKPPVSCSSTNNAPVLPANLFNFQPTPGSHVSIEIEPDSKKTCTYADPPITTSCEEFSPVTPSELIMNYDVEDILECSPYIDLEQLADENTEELECNDSLSMEVVELPNSDDDESNFLTKDYSNLRQNDPPLCQSNISNIKCQLNISEIKQEVADSDQGEENPGFFNKLSKNGYYKCRLCLKQYKTSKGLYSHTLSNHKDEVKIHHCSYCSFFTLWRSALMRHYNAFHGDVFDSGSNSTFNCHHCAFESRSKDQLSHHILNNHVYEKFTRCTFCRAQFSDRVSFTKHMKQAHLESDKPNNLNHCTYCDLVFSARNNYKYHMETVHQNAVFTSC